MLSDKILSEEYLKKLRISNYEDMAATDLEVLENILKDNFGTEVFDKLDKLSIFNKNTFDDNDSDELYIEI